MISRLKNMILASLAIVALAAPLGFSGTAFAVADEPAIDESLCQGADLQFNSTADCSDAEASASGLNELIANIINIFSVIVGIVAVIMIIIGGFKYITSGGDSGNVTGAKNTILYAIIGLVIVALAQFIVKFVLSKSTGLTES